MRTPGLAEGVCESRNRRLIYMSSIKVKWARRGGGKHPESCIHAIGPAEHKDGLRKSKLLADNRYTSYRPARRWQAAIVAPPLGYRFLELGQNFCSLDAWVGRSGCPCRWARSKNHRSLVRHLESCDLVVRCWAVRALRSRLCVQWTPRTSRQDLFVESACAMQRKVVTCPGASVLSGAWRQ